MEIALGSSLNTERAMSPFNDVEIKLKDTFFTQGRIRHPGHDEFFEFANGVHGSRKLQILGQLAGLVKLGECIRKRELLELFIVE